MRLFNSPDLMEKRKAHQGKHAANGLVVLGIGETSLSPISLRVFDISDLSAGCLLQVVRKP